MKSVTALSKASGRSRKQLWPARFTMCISERATDGRMEALSWFAACGVCVERVLAGNGPNYRSLAYAAALDRHGIRHKRTRLYRPQTNGKAERSIRTMLAEWAYGRHYRSNAERLAALPLWLDFYNQERPPTARLGLTPHATHVNNVRGNQIYWPLTSNSRRRAAGDGSGS